MDAMTVAIDLAKDVYQIAISNREGAITTRRRLTRRQFALFVESLSCSTTVVMESWWYRALLGATLWRSWGHRTYSAGAVREALRAPR